MASLCGVLVFDSVSRLLRLLRRLLFSPTICLSDSHTTLSHTIFHTQLCHTPSFTHHLLHTIFHAHFHTPSFTHHLSHTISHTPSFTHIFVNHHLSHIIFHTPSFTHTIFHTQLCHTLSFTHNVHTHHLSHTTLSHTPSFTYTFVTLNFVLLLDPPPPPLSFLLSPSPLEHLVLVIGRSCLVGLSGPFILSREARRI